MATAYAYKPGAKFPVSPAVAAEELGRLQAEMGAIRPDDVVNAARDPNAPLHPVFTSDWVRKALDHEDIVVARGDGGFLVRGTRALRELRLPAEAGVPQVGTSLGVAGWNEAAAGERYVHVAADQAWIALGERADAAPSVAEANARIDAFERDGATTRLRLSGHVPLSLSLRHPAGCSVSLDGRRLGAVRVADGLHHYATPRDGTETLTIGCP